MNLIENNPYRIAGILSNATARELQKQKAKIKAYSKVGKEIKSDYDFQFLSTITRTEDSIDKAFSSIEQNQDKVNHALFWFLNTNSFDDTALEYLKNGDFEKAVEIWENVSSGKPINSKNFSAYNNIGTCKLLSQNSWRVKCGLEAKVMLIESDYFENFVHSVADETYTTDTQKELRTMVDGLLSDFKNQYSVNEILQLFEGCDEITQKYIKEKLTLDPIHKIERQIESCKRKRKVDKNNAYEFGLNLFTNTKVDLSLIKSILGTGDLKYKMIADSLANEITQCAIDYFNKSQENDSSENYLELAQKLTKLADSIAEGKSAKDRAKDTSSSLAEMKDKELSNAISLLISVKDTYDKAYNEIIIAAKKQLGIYDDKEDFMHSIVGYSNRLGYRNPLDTRQINYSAVAEAARESINKEAVLNLTNKALSKQALIKIANFKNDKEILKLYDLLKDVCDNIIDVGFKEKIEILFSCLPQNSAVYKIISKIWEDRRRAAEKIVAQEIKEKREIIIYAILGVSVFGAIVGGIIGGVVADHIIKGSVIMIVTSIICYIIFYALKEKEISKLLYFSIPFLPFLFAIFLFWGIDGLITFGYITIGIGVLLLLGWDDQNKKY